VETTARGGNLLLDVGPSGDGTLPEIEVSLLEQLGEWLRTHGESVKGVRPASSRVDFYGPASQRESRLYLHLVMRPVETLVVRGIPVRRVKSVSLLGSGHRLRYHAAIDVHEPAARTEEVLGELSINAPAPTSSLIDVVVIDFEDEVP
jgi:alpha-L-fucosidase